MKKLIAIVMVCVIGELGAAEVVSTNTIIRCTAITKSGSQCSRKAVKGEKFCRQHLRIEQKKKGIFSGTP